MNKLRSLARFTMILALAVMLIGVAAPINGPAQATTTDDAIAPATESVRAQTANCTGGAAAGLVLDDGTFANENARGNIVTPLVTLFTIPGPVYQIQQVCICLTSTEPTTATFDIVMFDTSGAGGEPGAEVARFGPNSVTGIGSFFDGQFTWYDIPLTYTTLGGPLYVGLDFADPTRRFVCGDTSLTYNQTNKFLEEGLWAEDTLMDYGIRAEGGIPTVDLAAYASCSGDDLEISITDGDLPINIYVDGGHMGTAAALSQWYMTGPGVFNNVTLVETTGDLESLNLGNFNCPSYSIPNLGLVQINASAPIQPYGIPGLEMQNFVLPADSDGNGFDTYTVTDVEFYNGEYWLGLYLGSGDWVYVPYSAVIPLTLIVGIN